jgi:hypothetical protein
MGFIIAYFTMVYLAASRIGSVNQQQIPSSFSLPFAISLIDGEINQLGAIFMIPSDFASE